MYTRFYQKEVELHHNYNQLIAYNKQIAPLEYTKFTKKHPITTDRINPQRYHSIRRKIMQLNTDIT